VDAANLCMAIDQAKSALHKADEVRRSDLSNHTQEKEKWAKQLTDVLDELHRLRETEIILTKQVGLRGDRPRIVVIRGRAGE
jgi:hypothetical protein